MQALPKQGRVSPRHRRRGQHLQPQHHDCGRRRRLCGRPLPQPGPHPAGGVQASRRLRPGLGRLLPLAGGGQEGHPLPRGDDGAASGRARLLPRRGTPGRLDHARTAPNGGGRHEGGGLQQPRQVRQRVLRPLLRRQLPAGPLQSSGRQLAPPVRAVRLLRAGSSVHVKGSLRRRAGCAHLPHGAGRGGLPGGEGAAGGHRIRQGRLRAALPGQERRRRVLGHHLPAQTAN